MDRTPDDYGVRVIAFEAQAPLRRAARMITLGVTRRW
jgi:hypothetical protein